MHITKFSVMKHLTEIILVGVLAYLLYWRISVSMTRFFDVDEFSYLHWAANLAHGQRPYIDFLLAFTPGFLWFFTPLIWLFPFSAKLFLAARVVSLGIFLGMVALVGILFAQTRSKKWALLPVVILAFLPMPYDKFLETRPDNLATLFAFAGLVLEVFALTRLKHADRLWFWSGVSYMASLMVFAKTIPFVLVGGIVALLAFWWGRSEPTARVHLGAFVLGAVIPFGVFVLWVFGLGDIPKAWYSFARLPFEANMGVKFSVMEPHLFFFPNGSFYGGNTITLGYILNHALWFFAIVTGVFRFFTPFITANGDKKNVLVELLVAGTFVLSCLGYVAFFPLKHSQYLIPIALFIAYYAADAMVVVFRWIETHVSRVGVIIVLLVFSYAVLSATKQVNAVKLTWTNAVQLQQTDMVLSMITPASEVLDLEGRMLFWKDAYYICCIPFGSIVSSMSIKPPVLHEVLEAKKTPYIFQGDTNRLYLLPMADRQYIQDRYIPVPGWGESLWKRKE